MTHFKIGYDVHEVEEFKDITQSFFETPMSQIFWISVAIIISSLLSHFYLIAIS